MSRCEIWSTLLSVCTVSEAISASPTTYTGQAIVKELSGTDGEGGISNSVAFSVTLALGTATLVVIVCVIIVVKYRKRGHGTVNGDAEISNTQANTVPEQPAERHYANILVVTGSPYSKRKLAVVIAILSMVLS